MKVGLYPKLAWEAMRKNRRLYLPYLLTCAGMIMMFYIIHYLAAMPSLETMAGGITVMQMLGFGTWIVALFALLFLFYTNAFLVRRRQKEFGLYNILGMGKGNLSLLILWENGILFLLSMGAGLFGGILLSKLAELGLMGVLGEEITYDFTINPAALWDTLLIFVPIFCLLCLKNLWQVRRMSAVELLRRESAGEKPPKANYLLGLAGVVLLAGAYYIALSIQSPLVALAWFFIAVGMVVAATYLLFLSGSVTLCRLLQKNKGYYYRKDHFVSVSSMAYRMKRNGAGLASICILSTMVLVMMTGAGSLYFGAEDSLRARYPSQMAVSVDFLPGDEIYGDTPERVEGLVSELGTVLEDFDAQPQGVAYRFVAVTGLLKDGTLDLDPMTVNGADAVQMEDVCNLYFIPLADYNRAMGAHETLGEKEVLLHCVNRSYEAPTITMKNGTVWQVKGQVDAMMNSEAAAMDVIPAVFLVVSDLEPVVDCLNYELGELEDVVRVRLNWNFDTGLEGEEQVALAAALRETLGELEVTGQGGFYTADVECREAQRGDFYGTYGGIFFLGILLSIVFLSATVLILYYKQVTEGYEDESRFAIMRKVGMTAADIRKSVNAQMLTVFFLPLVTAVVHLCFAFPMVRKLLALFSLGNVGLMVAVLGGTVLVFGLFYTLVYRLTSNAYNAIVSGTKGG
ncbi:MAG: ABC transporter permease [Ruminiclostridium sp.]|nr:ABC transporter permease [Ruminiclostridium sp.]